MTRNTEEIHRIPTQINIKNPGTLCGIHDKRNSPPAAEFTYLPYGSFCIAYIGHMRTDNCPCGWAYKFLQTVNDRFCPSAHIEDIIIDDPVICKPFDGPAHGVVLKIPHKEMIPRTCNGFDSRVQCIGSIQCKHYVRRILTPKHIRRFDAAIVHAFRSKHSKPVRPATGIPAILVHTKGNGIYHGRRFRVRRGCIIKVYHFSPPHLPAPHQSTHRKGHLYRQADAEYFPYPSK